MSKNIATSIIIIFLFHFFYCINFDNVEICTAYIAYPSHTGHYGEKGVTSPENYYNVIFGCMEAFLLVLPRHISWLTLKLIW